MDILDLTKRKLVVTKRKLLHKVVTERYSYKKNASNYFFFFSVSNTLIFQKALPRAPESVEDTYIKGVILGGKASRSSIGSNVYHPNRERNLTGKRMVVIDGSNVAME